MHTITQYKFVILWTFVLLHVNCEMRVRWCTVSDEEQSKCIDMKAAFHADKLEPQLTCVQAMNQYACMRMIANDEADAIKLDDTDFYAAGRIFDLKPVMKERASSDLNAPTFLYKAVVIVRKDGPIKTLADLRGKRSCHTGVGRSAGWTIPVANLIAKGVIKVKDCSNPVASVAEFFSKSCAPGAFKRINNPRGDNKLTICALCENSGLCSDNDHYAGYLGSFSCLYDGRGDVSFQKHSTIEEFINDKQEMGLTVNKEHFRLLCPDDTLKHVDEWDRCYWGTRPSDVIVISSNKSEEYQSALKNLLHMAVNLYGPTSEGFKMFDSQYYHSKDLLFTDNTVKLLALGNDATYKTYFDEGFLNTMENYMTCGERAKWCVVSDAEMSKCTDMSAAFISKRITLGLQCVQRSTLDECMTMLRDGEADIMNNGGGDIYAGGRYYNLVPIISEKYDEDGTERTGTSYWAVAVARKNNPSVNLNNLKGKTSCHTGIQKSAGWNIPISYLSETGQISVGENCDAAVAVGGFFRESCVPGALNSEYDPNQKNPPNICGLCGGPAHCQRDSSNKYFGYTGTLRCLVEKNADVAFVNHLTVSSNTDGANTEPWAAHLKSSDFELLCPDGSRKPVSEFKNCNLARVPSNTIVTGHHMPDWNRTLFWRMFDRGQQIFDKQEDSKFKMFVSGDLGSDLLFRDSTKELEEIKLKKRYYETWLGKSYMSVMRKIDLHKCISSGGCVLNSNIAILTLLVFVLIWMHK